MALGPSAPARSSGTDHFFAHLGSNSRCIRLTQLAAVLEPDWIENTPSTTDTTSFWTQLSWENLVVSVNYLTGEVAWRNTQPVDSPGFESGRAGCDLGHTEGVWEDGLGRLARILADRTHISWQMGGFATHAITQG